MKKVLVTGAGGTVGIPVIKYLIKENVYEITALDLKSMRSVRRLKKYKDIINIIYGDVNDQRLMNALVASHDVVIHLAGVIPPFADLKQQLSRIVDYEGTKNIIHSIQEHNPKCYLLYPSSTVVYGGEQDEVNVLNEIVINVEDNYALIKKRVEEKISTTVKNYTIFRLPAVFGDLKMEAPMYNIPYSATCELISVDDAARAFVYAINEQKKLNKKIFNVTSGEKFRIKARTLMIDILQSYGISFRYLITWLLVDKNYYSHVYSDSDKLDDIICYQQDTYKEYLDKMKVYGNTFNRAIPKLLAKPIIFILKRKK